VPGPAGSAGSNGANGTNGINAFTTTAAQFVVPAINATVSVQVVSSAWGAIGQAVYVQNAGYYQISGIPDPTHFVLTNLGYIGNVAPGNAVASANQVAPSGLAGATGSSGVGTLNTISPTTTKGDLILDNGANQPTASCVRVGVGSDGQSLVANSSQPSGVAYASITPNSATDKAVARYDGQAELRCHCKSQQAGGDGQWRGSSVRVWRQCA
jgi:hypothetical protein